MGTVIERRVQSQKIKKAWKNGKFSHRDESYRVAPDYVKKVSDTMKKLWKTYDYTDRNKKISLANTDNHNCGRCGKTYYHHTCSVCKDVFISKRASRKVCNNCQSRKGILYKRVMSQVTKDKISRKLKGRIPKNLKSNITSKSSPRQLEMFTLIKKFFRNKCIYNYFVKTPTTHRWLDVAIPSLMIGLEYNGKVHLMKSVQEKDSVRNKELQEMGWTLIIIDRNNYSALERIVSDIKSIDNGDVY